jgi:hypothetical protein
MKTEQLSPHREKPEQMMVRGVANQIWLLTTLIESTLANLFMQFQSGRDPRSAETTPGLDTYQQTVQ